MNKEKAFLIFKYFILFIYIFCSCFIIYESCMKGPDSQEQSSAVTNIIISVIETVTNKKQEVHDFDSLVGFIRKLVGHFGAFLILGVFSSLTYLLFLNKTKKIYYIGIIINAFQALFLAILTESIQLIVPGRAGSIKDVLLDYSGFLVSFFLISSISLLIRYKKRMVPFFEN